MKRLTTFISLLLLFAAAFPAFSTELRTGLTYDSHQAEFPIGADFSLEETFENESSLSVGLAYKNAGAYTASILYNKYFDYFLLSGGLNYDISTTGIAPGIAAGAGFVVKDFSLTAGFTSDINAENIFKPQFWACTADMIMDTKESIIDLSFQYSKKQSLQGVRSKIGGGFKFTAYQDGAPADIDIIVNVLYLDAPGVFGISADAGMGINVYLPFMDISLKVVADVMTPELPTGSKTPFCITLSTGFKL